MPDRIDRRKLYSARHADVLRLARWLRLRVSCACDGCAPRVVEAVVREMERGDAKRAPGRRRNGPG